MKLAVLRTYDLSPDGVRVAVDWSQMLAGTSIFIPCINTNEAKKQVKQITVKKGWSIETRVRVEESRLGVRVWRVV